MGESQYSTGFFCLLFLGSGVSVLHRILLSPFSGFGSLSTPQDSSVSFFWVRESQYSTGFFCLLFPGSGVSVLHRILLSPFSGFGSLSTPQDFSVFSFWVRESVLHRTSPFSLSGFGSQSH